MFLLTNVNHTTSTEPDSHTKPDFAAKRSPRRHHKRDFRIVATNPHTSPGTQHPGQGP